MPLVARCTSFLKLPRSRLSSSFAESDCVARERRRVSSRLQGKRRFPPPWDIEEANASCFIVKDQNGRALAYVYYEEEPGRRAAAKPRWPRRPSRPPSPRRSPIFQKSGTSIAADPRNKMAPTLSARAPSMLTIHSVRVAVRGEVVNSEAIAGPPRAGLAHPATSPRRLPPTSLSCRSPRINN